MGLVSSLVKVRSGTVPNSTEQLQGEGQNVSKYGSGVAPTFDASWKATNFWLNADMEDKPAYRRLALRR